MTPPTREELLAGLEDAERVLRPGEAWHYSNLAFGLLGEIVARRNEGEYEPALRTRVLEPLGLARTGFDAAAAERDRLLRRPVQRPRDRRARPGRRRADRRDGLALVDGRRPRPLGGLPRDRAGRRPRARDARRDGARAHMVDQAAWTLGWGLGLELYRRGDRVFVGPRRRDAWVPRRRLHPPARAHRSRGAQQHERRRRRRRSSRSTSPRRRSTRCRARRSRGAPDDGAPDEVAPLLGRWWTEGNELVLSWQRRPPAARARRRRRRAGSISWLRPEADDRWRIVEGRELGELLRVVRDDERRAGEALRGDVPADEGAAAFADDASG